MNFHCTLAFATLFTLAFPPLTEANDSFIMDPNLFHGGIRSLQIQNATCGFADVASNACSLDDLCAILRDSPLAANGQTIKCSVGTETTWEVAVEFPQKCINRPESGPVSISDASMIDSSVYGECVVGTRAFLVDFTASNEQTQVIGYRQTFQYVAPTQNVYTERITPPETCREESQIRILDAQPFCTYACEHIDSFHLNGVQCAFSCEKCFLGRGIQPQIDCSNVEPNYVSTCHSNAPRFSTAINYPDEFPYEPTASSTRALSPLVLLSTLSVILTMAVYDHCRQ